jgi:hypothetical protein
MASLRTTNAKSAKLAKETVENQFFAALAAFAFYVM